MAQVQKASLDAIAECKKMTTMMADALTTRAAQQKDYDDRMTEYQRRKGLRDAALVEYTSKCSGACASGGVQEKGCHPMCTNWLRLNPEPIAPSAPVFPDLGTFVCTICNQSVDISATASRDVNVAKGAISQQMSCISSLEKAAATPTPVPGGSSGSGPGVVPSGTDAGGINSGGAATGAGTGAGTSGVIDSGTDEKSTTADTGFIASIANKMGVSRSTVIYGGAVIILIIVILFALLLFSSDDSRSGSALARSIIGDDQSADDDWELRA